MNTIWKYELKLIDEQTLKIPAGAEILTVQMQNDKLCMWAEVDSDNEVEDRKFLVRGTGNPIGEVGKYVGTFQLYEGNLAFHVFEM